MFDREPFTATLATDDGRLDFAIIMVHVTYGNAVAPRRAEVRLLAGYRRLSCAELNERCATGQERINLCYAMTPAKKAALGHRRSVLGG
jgi:hypothetical protein